MTRTSLRRSIAIAGAALALTAAAPPTVGPPWISIEVPPNPYDRASRGAFLVVHTYHHGQSIASGVTGTAEGIVGGARRTVRLAFDSTSRAGSYALRKQWPADGVWMLVINTGGMREGVTALVDIGAAGEVAAVRVPTDRRGEWDIPRQVTAHDVNAALQARAALLASAPTR